MNHDDEEDEHSLNESVDDEPPFALVDKSISGVLSSHDMVASSTEYPLSVYKSVSNFGNTESQRTEATSMGSSILYSPTPRSQSQTAGTSCGTQFPLDNSAVGGPGEPFDDFLDDDIEFDAAASLLEKSPSLGRSSHFMARSEEVSMFLRPKTLNGFSELIRQADDQPFASQTARSLAIPTLMEDSGQNHMLESTTSSMLTPKMKNHSLLGLFVSQEPSDASRSQNLFRKRGIQTERVDENTFEISLYLYSDNTVQDVMDVIGNPDLLRFWCESVRTLVITRSSEGSRSAAQRSSPERGDREYDGEWIEATTSALDDPCHGSSTFYQATQFLKSNLGFPSYGKITMFVERRRGKLSLTIGPFCGDLTAFHSLTVNQLDGCVEIKDRVRVAKIEEPGKSSVQCCCGLWDAVHRCLLYSKLECHMNQAISSLTRLRVMIEHGEVHSPSDLILDGEEDGVSRTPLLS